mmetsp:Transcript_23436/g.56578  ORF Transcript_23436/g.56578 Transcript_23436/m.56578 type:complete len:294 (-) Transcript_23436:1363-2244(-)
MLTKTGIAAAVILAFPPAISYAHENDYGVDASFPIHHSFVGHDASISATMSVFRPQKIDLYYEFMNGCHEFYDAQVCDRSENDRISLNLGQPRSMKNYTDTGFKKVRLSEGIWRYLREYWEETLTNGDVVEAEYWPEGNTYTNHWTSATRIKSIGPLYEHLYLEAERKVREWIPEAKSFSRSSLYGIRVYTEGSMLATHVDRDPLITSAIINVGQDVDEDWPLEVYDHDGRAHNITMQPGDMVLYESHTVLHGRPFPLMGRYYANVFVHFKPLSEGGEEDISKDGKDATKGEL